MGAIRRDGGDLFALLFAVTPAAEGCPPGGSKRACRRQSVEQSGTGLPGSNRTERAPRRHGDALQADRLVVRERVGDGNGMRISQQTGFARVKPHHRYGQQRLFNPQKHIHPCVPQTPRKSRNCRAITAGYVQPDSRFARSARMPHVRILIPSDSGSVLNGPDPAVAVVLLAFETLLKDRRDPFEALKKLTKPSDPNSVFHRKLTNHVSRNNERGEGRKRDRCRTRDPTPDRFRQRFPWNTFPAKTRLIISVRRETL